MSEQIQAATAPSEVIGRLRQAINDHDLEAMVSCFSTDVVSRQPAHPGRTFEGNDTVRRNWAMIFSGVPDIHAEVVRSAETGATAWTEWEWSGTRVDGAPHEMRGVTLNRVEDGTIVETTFYLEPVEAGGADVGTAIKASVGPRS